MQILSYSLTIPQRLYPALDRLFSIFRFHVNHYIQELWNENAFSLLSDKGSASSILKNCFLKPDGIPSRVYRNALELAGQIVRSHIERRKIFEDIVSGKEIDEIEDGASFLFVENIERQIKNVRKKGEPLDYFLLVRPEFSGSVVITSADDGQFKKLSFQKNGSLWFVNFEIKVPYPDGWKWKKFRKLCPDEIQKLLNKGAEPLSPLIKRERLSSGFTIYRLIIPFEVKEKDMDQEDIRIFSLDLSPSKKRLAVGVIVDKNGHSKPVFFKTDLIRKIERIQDQIDRLGTKIDRIVNDIHATEKKKERLRKRLNHLFQEQKLRYKKIANLRKEILEIFTNLAIEHARAYHCTHIAIERLSFRKVPDWKSGKALRRFASWFYSKVREKLTYKASLFGIKVIQVSPEDTSSICHKCGSAVEKNGLFVKCKCGTFDRDYNASVNIGIRALTVCHAKAKGYRLKAIPDRIPFRQGMTGWKALLAVIPLLKLYAWLKAVQTSYLRPQKLVRWIGSDKYG